MQVTIQATLLLPYLLFWQILLYYVLLLYYLQNNYSVTVSPQLQYNSVTTKQKHGERLGLTAGPNYCSPEIVLKQKFSHKLKTQNNSLFLNCNIGFATKY